LVELTHFNFSNKDDFYKAIRALNWPSIFLPHKTFAVKGFVQSQLFANTQFPLLLAKDAMVDDFRARTGKRPNVDLKNADVVIDLFIHEKSCTLSINTSGDPLFKRGYRKETGIAPLNEVVAAGMIYLSGWDRKSTFIDPMCGSGTLTIEAAMICSKTPASILRDSFTFMHLTNFDKAEWETVLERSKAKIQKVSNKILASDSSEIMITKTRRNIRTLPFARLIDLSVSDFEQVSIPSESGIMITNPPYGERIGDQIEILYKRFGDWMKQKLPHYSCWILSSNIDALKNIGLKANKTIKLYNGSLPCDFKRFDIFTGSKANLEN
jgi:putative N6-adenine-specific DNA methylase